jgi:hypothetical protein
MRLPITRGARAGERKEQRSPAAAPLEAKFAEGRLRFEVPSFLVYAVVEVVGSKASGQ